MATSNPVSQSTTSVTRKLLLRNPRALEPKRRTPWELVGVLGFLTALAATSGCKLQSKAETSNLIGMDGETPRGIIFSISQDEAEVGMYRLCRGPEGQPFVGYSQCRSIIEKYERSSMPNFENAPLSPSALGGDPLTESTPTNSGNPSSSSSSSSDGTAGGFSLTEGMGGGDGPATSVKVELAKKNIEEVEDPLFSGNHTTPRCWYRYNIKDRMPDLFSKQGRSDTFAKSILMTTYSLKSSDIIQAMKADTDLKKIILNIKDRDVMVAEKYNARLEAVTSNALWTMFNTALGAGLGTIDIDPIKSWVGKIAGGVEGASVGFTRFLLQQGKANGKLPAYTPRVGQWVEGRITQLWDFCFKQKNVTIAVGCTIAAGTGISKLLETAVNISADLSTQPQPLMDMDDKDLAKATNMIASSKTNIRIQNDEFEKLAYVPPKEGEPLRNGILSWFSRPAANQNIGIIPRLGDKLNNGFLCPNEQVAAKIALFRPLEEDQYQQIRDELRSRLPSTIGVPVP